MVSPDATSPVDPAPAELSGDDRGGTVFADLRDAIRAGKLAPGQKIAPLRSLAAQYGISATAARSAIARLERLHLLTRRHGSGTYVLDPATGSAEGQPVTRLPAASEPRPAVPWTQAVALFIASREHLFDRLAASIAQRCQRAGLLPVKLDWTGDARRDGLEPMFEQWRQQPPAAVVVQYDNTGQLDSRIAKACRGRTRIITTFRDPFAVARTHHIGPDYPGSAAVAAEHLLGQGHTRLGFITAGRPASWRGRYYTQLRQKMRAIGQLLRERELIHGYRVLRHADDPQSDLGLASIARWLQRADRPTALIGDDFRIVGVLRAASRVGVKIPADLAVVGIGDTPWAHTFEFPSVSFREDDIAAHIARLICDPTPNAELPLYQITVPARLTTGPSSALSSAASELFCHLEPTTHQL